MKGIRRRSPKRFIVLPMLLIAGWCVAIPAAAEAEAPSNAEAWVLGQLRAGKVADLAQRYTNTNDRKLRGAFLERLLTDTTKASAAYTHGVAIWNAVVSDPINLDRAEIPHHVVFQQCVFENDLNLNLSHFHRSLFLQDCRFGGRFVATNAEVDGILVLDHSLFAQTATLEGMKIGRDLFLFKTSFNGAANFSYVDISGDLAADGAQFNAEQETAFIHAKINGSLSFWEADITDGQKQAKQPVTFKGEANFRFANIGGNFAADGARFESVSSEASDSGKASFASDGMTVAGHLFLRKATFAGEADFRRTHTGGDFELSETRFAYQPNFFLIHVGDTFYLDGTEISGLGRFDGMTYQFIHAGKNLREWFDTHSEYDAGVYRNLESVLQRHGFTDLAKELHIAGRQRGRYGEWQRTGLKGLHRWLWDYAQDKVAGYGRHLERALIWSVGFIIIGCIVFWREDWMETQNEGDAKRYEHRYRPFWYSLAVFLPIVALPDAKIWMPQRHRRFRRFYMRLHIILGYLLIPIGIAAWTGIIK